MNENMNLLFDFDDLLIEPAVLSKITSRSEINPHNIMGKLPIMTAPMDTVVGENNFHIFKENKIMPVLPRIPNANVNWFDTSIFLSYSLQDFDEIFLKNTIEVKNGERLMVLIDVANGHMENLYELAKKKRKK
jgi:hypothetical protein